MTKPMMTAAIPASCKAVIGNDVEHKGERRATRVGVDDSLFLCLLSDELMNGRKGRKRRDVWANQAWLGCNP